MSQIDELLQQMTIEEKIAMLDGADLWHSVAVPRLGVPQFRVTDGPNGARGSWGSMGPSSVATPVGIALGATWNPDLVEKVGNLRHGFSGRIRWYRCRQLQGLMCLRVYRFTGLRMWRLPAAAGTEIPAAGRVALSSPIVHRDLK